MSLMTDIRHQLVARGKIPLSNRPFGCADIEISALKKCQCVTHLPHTYTEFLSELGQNTGQFLQDWKVTYDWILTAKQEVISRHFGKFDVKRNMFIFAGSNPKFTTFSYFEIDDSIDDPKVYIYENDNLSIYFDTLSEFYKTELEKLSIEL